MVCPKCAEPKIRTISTKSLVATTKRVKQCHKCDFIFHSEERPILINFMSDDEIKEYNAYIEQDSN